MYHKLDLHTHSCASDGTDRPADVVRAAKAAGVELLALTDHDTVRGLMEAQQEAQRQGITLIPAVEMDTEFPEELHILGLDIDPDNAALRAALARTDTRRKDRNERIMDKLLVLGHDVRPYMPTEMGTYTRMHVALALQKAGVVNTPHEAFERFLKKGMPAYAAAERYTPQEVIELIRGANGIAVIAHPCKLKCSAQELIANLVDHGLQGVEAYYGSATPGQIKEQVSLAKQYRLRISSGSDYHGAHRPKAQLGCAWQPVACLEETAEFFRNRVKNRQKNQS